MGSVRAVIVGRFALALLIGALVLLPGSASAQLASSTTQTAGFADVTQVTNPMFEQYEACTGSGVASQELVDYGGAFLQAADDFNVSGAHTLAHIIALGSTTAGVGIADPITYEVYDIDGPGGLPGTMLCTEALLPNAGDQVAGIVDITLDGSCSLTSGSYWLSVYAVQEVGTAGQWFWSSNETGYGETYAWQDTDDLFQLGCPTWSQTCLVATYPNLCFGIGDTGSTGDGGGGVPAVGTTGVVLMLLIVMAISFFYLRRRQTA